MSDPRVADEVLVNLAVVRGNLQQVWRSVDELRAYARGAERALDDVEVETSRARLTTDPAIGAVSLRNAGDQLDVLRQRCALSSSMAEEVEERLGVAKRHVEFARDRLEHYDPGPGNPDAAAALSGLRTQVEDLAVLVDLAIPLAQGARTHMREAAETAAALTSPNLVGSDLQYSAFRVDRGTQTAGRSVVRADESVRHLDRTLESAGAGAARSLGRADLLANSAHDRLLAEQHRSTPALDQSGVKGPPR